MKQLYMIYMLKRNITCFQVEKITCIFARCYSNGFMNSKFSFKARRLNIYHITPNGRKRSFDVIAKIVLNKTEKGLENVI